ncbi:MAG: glycosyltransferase family 25 protein [Gammaproteobacteria bacterium]|nr:glycosyltransferase family 25 protein [Gammaproteobacteria bacterium]
MTQAIANSRFAALVEAALIINLDDRTDRWAQVESVLDGVLPTLARQRLPAVRGTDLDGFGRPPWFRGRRRDRTWAGRAGVLLSHRRALQQARAQGWRNALILEDDVVFTGAAPPVLEQLAITLQSTPWDICYLGYTDPKSPFVRVADLGNDHALWSVSGCNTAHAYLVRDTAFEWILARLPNEANVWDWLSHHRAVDRWYYRNLSRRFRVLAISPSVVNQRPGISDITQRDNDGRHVTSVNAAQAITSGFGWRNTLRHAGWRLAEPRDWLRGRIKRLRGF